MTLDILDEAGKEVVIRLFEKMATEDYFTNDDFIDLKTKVKFKLKVPTYVQEVENTCLFLDKLNGTKVPLEHQFFLNVASTPLTNEQKMEYTADRKKCFYGRITNSVLSRGDFAIINQMTKFNSMQEAYRLIQYLRTALALGSQDYVIEPNNGVEQN